jgi:hypothetical protein
VADRLAQERGGGGSIAFAPGELLIQRISQLQEAYDKVCRKNAAFQNDVLAGSILESAVDFAGDVACKAKQFVERRSMIADFRAKTATDDGSYPLLM